MDDLGVVELKLVRVGGSLRVTVPARFARAVGFVRGDRVRAAYLGDVFVVTPVDGSLTPVEILTALAASRPSARTIGVGSS